jgi:DNA-directed RNA polymerase delta subunit
MRCLKPEDRLSRSAEMLSTELDEETVLMSIDAGAYYGMEKTARFIWEKLKTPMTFSALVDEMVKEYEIAPEDCAADLQGFLAEMEREGLLHVE